MSAKKINILIVDDNIDHQILMQEALLKLIDDVTVVFAGTGEECFLELLKENYDAMVIDFNLSDMNGLEVLRRMNNDEYHIPAIMVTAFGDENIAVDAMKLGAFDYIVKSEGYLNRLSSIILRMMQEPKLKKEKEKVESDLRASELKYKILIDNMIDVVFTADKELNIISINLAGQRVFEYSCEEIKGLNFYDLIFDADKEKIIDCINGSFAGNREFLEGGVSRFCMRKNICLMLVSMDTIPVAMFIKDLFRRT